MHMIKKWMKVDVEAPQRYLCNPVYACMQVRELQTELMVEQKKSEEYQKGVRGYERRCRELTHQVCWHDIIWHPPPSMTYWCSTDLAFGVFHWFSLSSCSQKRTGRLCWGCRSWLINFSLKSRATKDKLRMQWVFISVVGKKASDSSRARYFQTRGGGDRKIG